MKSCRKEFLALNTKADINFPKDDKKINEELLERIKPYNKKEEKFQWKKYTIIWFKSFKIKGSNK